MRHWLCLSQAPTYRTGFNASEVFKGLPPLAFSIHGGYEDPQIHGMLVSLDRFGRYLGGLVGQIEELMPKSLESARAQAEVGPAPHPNSFHKARFP